MPSNNHYLLFCLLLVFSGQCWAKSVPAHKLFGYQESARSNLQLFPQWLSMLDRHLKEMAPAGDCKETRFNQCHLKQWQAFLYSIRSLPEAEQVKRVNQFANEQKYILDIENYGVEDYWATPKQFLDRYGDCEDYAIIKLLSLKQLGVDPRRMRVVVVQDTNLRVAHAVLSLDIRQDIVILDNQIKEVISHKDIFHYVPIYSLNENNWWMHVPDQ